MKGSTFHINMVNKSSVTTQRTAATGYMSGRFGSVANCWQAPQVVISGELLVIGLLILGYLPHSNREFVLYSTHRVMLDNLLIRKTFASTL